MSPRLTVLVDPPRAHRLAWIHRAEARAIAAELRAAGREIDVSPFDASALPDASPPLLRLSDPLMVHATRVLSDAAIGYHGPGAAPIARCYDKWLACETVAWCFSDVTRRRLSARPPPGRRASRRAAWIARRSSGDF